MKIDFPGKAADIARPDAQPKPDAPALPDELKGVSTFEEAPSLPSPPAVSDLPTAPLDERGAPAAPEQPVAIDDDAFAALIQALQDPSVNPSLADGVLDAIDPTLPAPRQLSPEQLHQLTTLVETPERKETPTRLEKRVQGVLEGHRDRTGRTPLHEAIAAKVDLPTLRAMIEAGVDVKVADKEGRTALYEALAAPDPELPIVRALIEAGADVKVQDKEGRTALHEIVRRHLSLAPDMSEAPETREVPLAGRVEREAIKAERKVERESAREPARREEEAAQRDREPAGRDQALARHKQEAARHATEPLATREALHEDKGQQTVHETARETLHETVREIVHALIAAGADVKVADKEGRTPLHEAASRGDPALIEPLLRAGASPHVSDHLGKSPLANAAESGHPRAVLALMQATPHAVRSNLEVETLRSGASKALAQPHLSDPEREQWQRIVEALPLPPAKAQEIRPVTVPALPREVATLQVRSALQRQIHLVLSAPTERAAQHTVEPQTQHALNKGLQQVVALLSSPRASEQVAAKVHFIVSEIANNTALRSNVLLRLAARSTNPERARLAVDEAVRYLQIPPRNRPAWGVVHEDHEDLKEVHLEQQLSTQLATPSTPIATQAPMYQNVAPGTLGVTQPVVSTGGSLGIAGVVPAVGLEEPVVSAVSNESSGGGGSAGGGDDAGDREREAAREQREKKNEKDKKKARQKR